MARRSKEEIRIEREVSAACNKHGQMKQFDIMDLSKISDAGKAAAKAGASIDEAVAAACDKYEVKR